jgi:hypothetical protein
MNHSLSIHQIDGFINNGFVKIENTFSAAVAAQCVDLLWKATHCQPDDQTTWTQPVIRIGEMTDAPFIEAANSAFLHNAFNQLVGKDNWIPKTSIGSFPIRFPSQEKAKDTGWHVDASFPGENSSNYLEWRINFKSKARGLLMLFLFSDVSENDAPTKLKIGSHLNVARLLAPAGEKGLAFMELAAHLDSINNCEEINATGKAGTVYLCHPFIVHAAQDHLGTKPKFMAQPALMTKKDFTLDATNSSNCPVVKAILKGLNKI